MPMTAAPRVILPALLVSLIGPAAQAGVVRNAAELVAAVAQARQGEVIQLIPGDYGLDGPLLLNRPGPALIAGAGPAEQVVVTSPREVMIVSAASWTLRGLTLRGAVGVRVAAGGSGVRLQAVRVVDSGVGFDLGEPSDLLCAISGVVLENNVLARIGGDAIRLGSVCAGAQIRHQTVWGAAGRALLVQGPSQPPILANNIWSGPIAGGPQPGPGDLQLPSATSREWFLSPDQLNLRLRAGATPIDRGVATQTGDDADGNRRPAGRAADVGAFEYQEVPDDKDGGAGADAGGGLIGGPAGGGSARPLPRQPGGCATSAEAAPGTGKTGLVRLGLLLGLVLVLGLRRRR